MLHNFLLAKKIFIPLLLFFAVIAGIIAYLFFSSHPSLFETQLEVISTSPQEQASVSPFSPVIITFNRTPKENEYTITMDPPTKITILLSSKNSILVKPATNFSPEMTYKLNINTTTPFVLTFETQQEASNLPGMSSLFNQTLQNGKPKNGALAAALSDIRKNSPIQQPGFTVNYSYDTNVYTITLSAPYDTNKTSFLSWLSQKGVSDLSEMTLKYINQ